jgi:hypothetical protein
MTAGELRRGGWQKDQIKEEVYFIPAKDTPSHAQKAE